MSISPRSSPLVTTQARCGDPRQGGVVSVGPIWHACIAIRPAEHRSLLGVELGDSEDCHY